MKVRENPPTLKRLFPRWPIWITSSWFLLLLPFYASVFCFLCFLGSFLILTPYSEWVSLVKSRPWCPVWKVDHDVRAKSRPWCPCEKSTTDCRQTGDISVCQPGNVCNRYKYLVHLLPNSSWQSPCRLVYEIWTKI